MSMNPEQEDPYSDLYREMLQRIEALEERVSRLPCDHVEFPIDEEYELDEDGFEVSVNLCRNCGERVETNATGVEKNISVNTKLVQTRIMKNGCKQMTLR